MRRALSLLITLGVAAALAGLAFNSFAGAQTKNGFDLSNATIPVDEILSGGPPRDGIPSIDNPKFVAQAKMEGLMEPQDRLISMSIGGTTRAYPLRILVWHEIVNDRFGDKPVAVTYCPLCGTGMVFSREVAGRTLEFGVSGLLYQSDVLMYDRQTESLWSQLKMEAVSGPMVGEKLEWLPAGHTTWQAWKAANPQARVLADETGFRRDYDRDPYAGYAGRPGTVFPVATYREELPRKAWVAGIRVDGTAKAYPRDALAREESFQDEVAGQNLELSYEPQSETLRIRNVNTGEAVPFVWSFWFAWQAFYPETRLWKSGGDGAGS